MVVSQFSLFSDWRRPTFITSVNPGLLGYDRTLKTLHPKIELIEIRLDGAWTTSNVFAGNPEDFNKAISIVRQAQQITQRPVLATFRTEGGKISISPELYEELNSRLASICNYIDIESNYPLMRLSNTQISDDNSIHTEDTNSSAYHERFPALNPEILEESDKRVKNLVNRIHEKNTATILSQHFWQYSPTNPTEILQLFKHQVALGADVAKLAYTPQNTTELKVLQKAGQLTYQLIHKPTMLIGMGELGKPTRLAGPQSGNWGTFVTANSTASAPGQLPLAELELRYPSI